MELKKISENIWEIPKEGKMNVPGRIFASEKLIKDIKNDKTLEQIKNVACLPGIIQASIACPDAHRGYGFPIGGVAAFDIEKGVISPGGVGYDINCLSGNSKILSSFGYYKKIEEFEGDYKEDSLTIFNKENIKSDNSTISLFLKKNSEKIIKIKTKSGNEILATEEHPIFTKDGMKIVYDIKKGENLLVYSFEGVEYEKPKSKLLISEEDIDTLIRSSTSKLQIKNKLKSLGLLPLYSDSPKIPYLLKIMGFIFGDGNLNIGKNSQIGFYGKKEDLLLIKEDLNKIGFSSNLYSRQRTHKLKTAYKEYEFSRIEESLHNQSSALAILLSILGTPTGNKATQDYKIPEWIMDSPKWYKRLFLASLFGAELSSPKTMTNHSFNFYGPVYSINKENVLHGVEFINQIDAILEEFEIKSVLIKNRTDELNGKKSNRIRLMIHADSNNLIKLYSKINYEYNIKKRKLANAAIIWLKQKEKVIDLRERKMIEARLLKKQGLTKTQIINRLSCYYINKHFINKAIYQENYGKTGSRIAFCFISFDEFVNNYSYGEDGFVWDEIESKEEINHDNYVYDFTMNNKNHNFIANGFVVSNCSVRLLRTNLTLSDIEKISKKELIHSLFRTIPSGVGEKSKLRLTKEELNEVLKNGAQWAVKNGYGNRDDYLHTEDNGKLPCANPSDVSDRAKQRGMPQLGSFGAGNHFLEIQKVEKIFDEKTAEKFGLKKDMITIMIHCGSRGLGHQVASDYIQLMGKEYGWPEFDRELVNAPIQSELGKKYLSAMACAANFAFANKQMITHWIREDLKHYFPNFSAEVVYDVCHNIAKFENHLIDEKNKEVLIMRKGATRSFGPGRKEIPEKYRQTEQPVIIPGSMGTSSYVLVGTREAEELSFGSTAHGAGRVESRTSARKNITSDEIKKQLEKKGIEIEAGSYKGIVEEAPEVYKDIDEVVRVSNETGIGKLVAKLIPLAVMKG